LYLDYCVTQARAKALREAAQMVMDCSAGDDEIERYTRRNIAYAIEGL
jgi:hypothetical protein